MATLVFSALGTLIGGPVGGMVGALVGRQVDGLILGSGTRQGARLTELAASTSSYGAAIPRQFGTMRVPGQIVWATDLAEHSERHGNGKGAPATIQYTYTASFAVALSSRPILGIGRIWADGTLLRGAAGDLKVGGTLRLHLGHGDQPVDPLLASAEPAGRCPAYRGLAYLVFEDLQLASFGNRIPALSVEVIADPAAPTLAALVGGVIEDCATPATLAPLAGLSLDGALADTLAMLAPVCPLACDAGAEVLTLGADAAQAAPLMLGPASVSAQPDDFGAAAGFVHERAATGEAPLAVLRYYDIARDYQPGSQRAPGMALPGEPRTVDLPAALAANDARTLIDTAARRARWGRQTLAWRVAAIDPAVVPGALVTVPGQPGLWQVRDWEWRASGVELALVRRAPTAAAALPTDPGRALAAVDLAGGPTLLAACELPWDGNPASPAPMLLAAASSAAPGWSGAALYLDAGDGALQPLGTAQRQRAIIGTALTALPAASPLLLDRHTAVTVQLVAPDLALDDATLRQLATGANRAVLGEELIQFARAEPLGGGLWRLSGLLRGRAGTESGIAGHSAGERFILLAGPATQIDAAALSLAPPATVAAIGLGDTAPASSAIALAGIGTRPPAPVHGRLTRRPDGSARLDWTRRARGAWAWADGQSTPLGEQAERYAVTFDTGGEVLMRWEPGEPSLTIPAAQWAALAAPAGVFTIRQIGDRGTSEPLTVALI